MAKERLWSWWILFLYVPGGWGWGPFTHAGFGALFYGSLPPNDRVIATNNLRGLGQPKPLMAQAQVLEEVFVAANFFPDAFKKAREWMHTFEYAAFQLEQSAGFSNNHSSTTASCRWNNSMDFIHTDVTKAFSYGYMIHLLEDFVGHHQGGYLNPMRDHLQEFEVDTLFYNRHKNDALPWPYKDNAMSIVQTDPQVKRQLARFISETSQKYAKQIPVGNPNNMESQEIDSQGGLSVKQVGQCIRQFTSIVHAESFALIVNEKIYRSAITRYDVCNATNFDTAIATLHRATHWVQEAIQVFETNLFPYESSSGGRALVASRVSRKWVEDTFARNGGTICGGNKTDGEGNFYITSFIRKDGD